VTESDLVPLFQNFGYIVEVRMQPERGYAFIKMDIHENAAMAICQLHGFHVQGRNIRCSWGKQDKQQGYENSPTQGYPISPQQQYYPQYAGPTMAASIPQANYEYPYNSPSRPAAYGQQQYANSQQQQQQQQYAAPPQTYSSQMPGAHIPDPNVYGQGVGSDYYAGRH